jgi:hypothetical protein
MLSAKKKNRKLNQYNGFVGKLLSQGRITKEEIKEFFDKKTEQDENNARTN